MKPLSLLILAGLLLTTGARAAIHMCAIFGDHMVLQQDAKLPVWGNAPPGESVTVTLGDHTGTATADANGNWRVDLPPVPTTASATTLTVKGASNTLTFQDVLVGEVWVASGQSNMEFDLVGEERAKDLIAQANQPQIRLFHVVNIPGIIPKTDVTGKWEVCTPDSVPHFSAVAYLFGLELQKKYHGPVGLIESAWGGTPIQTWMSFEALKLVPTESGAVWNTKAARNAFPKDPAAQTALMADYRAKLSDWQTNVHAPFQVLFDKWQLDCAAAKAAGQPLPPGPHESPGRPHSPDGEGGEPTTLYNGLIAPLMPYAIKGVIWFQGEANGMYLDQGHQYARLFETLITDWRKNWGEGDFPFLFMQLSSWTDPAIDGAGGFRFAVLREAQAQTLSVPNTGMVATVDIGAGNNIHPPDKLDVAQRLALVARHVAYGEKDLVDAGPTYDKMTVEGGTIRVSFTNTGSGLVSMSPPWHSPFVAPTPASPVLGFTIAGADKKFVLADAKIDGNSVIVSSPQVAAPVAVRYYWENLTQANLYNKEGLPAFPFRSDTWDDVASPANPPAIH